MKLCKICNQQLPTDQFYRSRRHKDGCFKCCKACHKLKVKAAKNYPEARKRATQHYCQRFPNRVLANVKAKRIPVPKGYERHHWSYQEAHWLDVIIMKREDHRRLHQSLIRDLQSDMYCRKDTGELLDTRAKHEAFIEGFLLKLENRNIKNQQSDHEITPLFSTI